MQIADRRRFLRALGRRGCSTGRPSPGPVTRVRFRSLSGENEEHERQSEWIGAGYADEAHAIGELARARRSGCGRLVLRGASADNRGPLSTAVLRLGVGRLPRDARRKERSHE